MRLGSAKLIRTSWSWSFGLLVATPALLLAALGLRAVRSDRIERAQQLRDRQAQPARLVDAGIRTGLAEIERELRIRDAIDVTSQLPALDSVIRFFSLDRAGLLRFSSERVYFGDSRPRDAYITWPANVEQLIEQARAAEAQQNTNTASALYNRIIATEPRLRAWSRLALLHLAHKDDKQFFSEILSDEPRNVTDLTPSGLPVALSACAYAASPRPEDHSAYSPILLQALAQLRSGRWWLSFEERSFYDQEIRRLLVGAGIAHDMAADARLQELARMAQLVGTVPRSRDEATRYVGRSEAEPMLILLSPSQHGPNLWQGAGLNRAALVQVLDQAMKDAGAPKLGETWVKDDAGDPIWGAEGTNTAQANSVALPVIPAWTLSFNSSSESTWLDRRTMLWLGLIAMLIATMLVSLFTTMRVVRREAELARMQNDFIGGVSHELKSPITSVRLLVERMTGGRLSPSSAAHYHTAVERELNRLNRNVNRLLEAQQIQAGQRQYNFASASLSDAAADAIDELATVAEAKQIRIERELNPNLRLIQLDRAAMTDAIANLISNAIKYSAAGTVIAVTTRLDGDSLLVEVSDEGIGLDRKDSRRIFNRFYRGKGSHRVSAGGTGLGLALVKATVEAHRGSISVKSDPGKGSSFTIRLPLGQ